MHGNVWQVEILAATKLTVLSQSLNCATGRESNIELLMLILDFVLNSRLKSTCSKAFLCNPWNVLTRMRTRRRSTFCTLGVGTI